MRFDLFLSLAEAIAPAPTPPPVPTTPPVIERHSTPSAGTIRPSLPATRAKTRSVDLDGTTFEHEDPDYLRAWIEARNASLVASRAQLQAPLLYMQPMFAPRVCGPTGCR